MKLCLVSIAVELNVKFPENVSKGQKLVNRRGPRTEPWGTPLKTGVEPDLRFLSWTNCVRPVR